jgi:hypothetical protein
MHQDHHQRIGAYHEASAVIRAQLGIVAHSVMLQRRKSVQKKNCQNLFEKKRGKISYLAPPGHRRVL